MCGFLSKYTDIAAPQSAVEIQSAVRAEARQFSDQARQQALSQADMLRDEAADVAFILQSGFADVRRNRCKAERHGKRCSKPAVIPIGHDQIHAKQIGWRTPAEIGQRKGQRQRD